MTVESALPAISSTEERDILRRYANGTDVAAIVTLTQHSRDKVDDAVSRIAGFDRGRARAAVLAYDATTKAAEQGRVTPNDTINDQLAAAEKSGIPKAVRLAERIRTLLADLNAVMRDSETERVLKATIAVLRKHIDKATEELRDLKAGTVRKPAVAQVGLAKTNGAVPGKVIRQWAADNNIDCRPNGPVPRDVRALYEARGAS